MQIAMASSLFADLAQDREPSNYKVRSLESRFRRLVYSAVRCLADDVDFDLPAIAVYRHLEEHLDPWLTHEQALGVVRSELEGRELAR